ncbi:MAG: 23S rRNA (adenine(2503)-C(2))-methyltransferase RlmN [Oscillospiraceae bacterium]|jgi:23S rRNA (adenine2503-C2)-methyltransferase
MTDIKSLLPEELGARILEMGESKFRAGQIFQWLGRGVRSFDEMTNLSKALREKLKQEFYITSPKLIRKQVSKIDGTIKYLWELADGNAVETVVMRYKHGNTVCISSQVGCRMGCRFCASTLGGLIRNMEPSEMLDEVLFSQIDSGKPISNIVLMGIGEPLDNFDNVIRFLELVHHPDGMNIGMRHISLSTCGLIERIDKLGKLNLQLTLSVSLHAPDSATRSRIMPVNQAYPVDALMETCARYFQRTGRRISFEYAMIDGINDTDEHARLLAEQVGKVGGHVNLIPLNHVEEREFAPTKPERLKAFIRVLQDRGINVTVRRRLGSDVDASCGQLRRKAAREQLPEEK